MNGCCHFFRNSICWNSNRGANIQPNEIVEYKGLGDGLAWDESFSSGPDSPRYTFEDQPCRNSTPKRNVEEGPLMTSTPTPRLSRDNSCNSSIV